MKNKLRLTSYISAVALVFSLWTFSGCSKSSDAAPTMNILTLIASTNFKQSSSVTADKALDSLVKYINIYPDHLVTLLSGTDKYTLFAPSNTAFINLLATPGFPANIKQINPALIQEVLYYHIVSGQQLHSSLTSGASFTSVAAPGASAGEAITVNTDGTLLTGSTNTSIQIVTPDQKATNGVVHVTGTVLIPPSVGASLTPILGTMAGTVLLGADFTDLAAIIYKADATFTNNPTTGSFSITSWLAMPTATQTQLGVSGITFFAIPNAVFKAAAAQQSITEAQLVAALSATSDAARGLLLNHLTTAKQYTTSGTNKFSATTTIVTKGKAIAVTSGLTPGATYGPYGIVFANATPSNAYLAQELSASTNGQVQVIAGILK
jgi:uncharacterized surface protein with fasciclin (FAS1) repeats